MAITPKASWPWVRTLLHSVFDQPDVDSVAAQYDRIIAALSDKLPKVAEHLDAARIDLLAFTAVPKQIWRKIWSNNPIVIWSGAVGSACELRVCVLDGVVDAARDRCLTPVSSVRSFPNCDLFSAGRRAGVDRCRGVGRGRRPADGVVAGSPRRVHDCGGWRFQGASAESRRWRAAGWVSVCSVGSGAGRAGVGP